MDNYLLREINEINGAMQKDKSEFVLKTTDQRPKKNTFNIYAIIGKLAPKHDKYG